LRIAFKRLPSNVKAARKRYPRQSTGQQIVRRN
jgi:hypothetical protein